jgi:predicted ATPase/DNA-binding SARP family transcriptional activator
MTSFRILGPIEVWADERRLALGGRRQASLFAFLVLHANRAVSADTLIEEVWGSRRSGAANRLPMAVARLRKVLEPLGGGDQPLLRTVAGGYRLSIAPDQLDAALFEAGLREGKAALETGDPVRAQQLVARALALWRGPPLAEVAFEDFALVEIRRLEELRLAALEVRIDADLLLGGGGELVAELEALVGGHPEREHVAAQLMRALYAAGRQAEALDAYQRTRSYLPDELGLEPGPELQAIQAHILNHASALTAGPAPPDLVHEEVGRRPGLRGSRLPVPPGRLIGREPEVAVVLELLADSEVRLVTLLGVGGAGKTRLGIEVARRTTGRYRDGARLVLLASVTDAALVAGHIARAVGIDPVAGQPIEQSLASALADRELLLILDNFEHLLGGAMIVSEVLAAAPGVDVLATSREPLRIAGEQRVDVPPLELTHARELFVARARGVRRDLAVGQDERSAIDAICEQLDGLPLALELAAARIAVFSPQALRARLADRLSIASRQRDTPERHETLRATLDWSYRLLSDGEQVALAALAPFIGGVRVDDAEQIWGGATVEALVALTEKSLLRRREDQDGQTRFWMLETVRQYALEEAARTFCLREAADEHARHQLVLSDRAAAGLEGPEQRYWLDRLEPELPEGVTLPV